VIPETCALAESERWSAYADKVLTADDRARADEHLTGCIDCRATVSAIASIKLRAQSAEVAPPTALLESIKREVSRPRLPWIRTGIALLAASLLIAFGLTRREGGLSTSSASTVDLAATQSLRHTLSTLDDAITTARAELARNPDDKLLEQLLRDAQADKSRALASAQDLARRSQ
jgi:Predicted transmembrane transcriptional regulator (anti-sigma factor)